VTEPVLTPAATGAHSVAETAAPGHAAQSAAQSANSNAALPNRNPAGTINTLTVRNLEKRYGKRTVVKDVSLDVKSGEVVGLLGPNGAGKTTSFYMIVGLVALDAGTITLNDASISTMPIHERARLGLSYLPQEASVFRKLTVDENIRAVLELQLGPDGKALTQDEVMQRAEALMEELQILHLRSNPALSLSGGERRRVEIARALATNPSFILLDEPFAGVDPIAVLEIQKIVRFLKERNIGVLITDHNVRETLGICNHAYIISDGSVLAAGAPAEIVENEHVRRVYLGEHFRM
jgi:lipopolysaccharide export system ATP-binding protein